jgi:coiled-coil domain-containing protein 55
MIQVMNVSLCVRIAVKKRRVQMSKYGLNLRPAKGKKQPPRPSIPLPFGFNEDDDNDVEKEIAIQASKTKSLKDVC